MTARTLVISLSRKAVLPRLVMGLLQRFSLRRSRRRLSELDDHLLRDVGITRTQAKTEAARPLWDAPDRWRR